MVGPLEVNFHIKHLWHRISIYQMLSLLPILHDKDVIVSSLFSSRKYLKLLDQELNRFP